MEQFSLGFVCSDWPGPTVRHFWATIMGHKIRNHGNPNKKLRRPKIQKFARKGTFECTVTYWVQVGPDWCKSVSCEFVLSKKVVWIALVWWCLTATLSDLRGVPYPSSNKKCDFDGIWGGGEGVRVLNIHFTIFPQMGLPCEINRTGKIVFPKNVFIKNLQCALNDRGTSCFCLRCGRLSHFQFCPCQ